MAIFSNWSQWNPVDSAAELEAENIQSWVCEFGGNFVARIEEGLRDAGLISCFGRLRGRILGLDASRMDFG